MTSILACIDRSEYARSVCYHAAWFADRMRGEVTLLNVREREPRSDTARAWSWMRQSSTDAPGRGPSAAGVLRIAAARLADEGLADVRRVRRSGRFATIATELAADADLVVLGRRGVNSGPARSNMGSNVDRVVRATETPVCLTPKIYLPIDRALVLLDADPGHQRTGRFIASHGALRGLEMDLVVMGDGRTQADDKVSWARETLDARGDAAVFPMPASDPDQAAALYLQSRGCDLLIMSRELLEPDPQALLRQIEGDSLWAWRTPVLIC